MARPSPTFGDHALGCAPAATGGGCGQGVCWPQLQPPFGNARCIFKNGMAPCPAGYPNGQTVFTDFDAMRACQGCTGQAPCNQCPVQVDVFSDSACTTGMGSVGAFCWQPNGVAAIEIELLSPCMPSGGGSGGVVVGKSPVTVCCP